MIPNIVRGDRMVGLVSYLAGPGRANEHTNPHVVAGSDGVMAWHSSEVLDHDAAMALGKELDRPKIAHDATMKGGHVWHCSLSVASVEGELGDELWGEVAHSFVQRMGFDTQEDTKAPMRWAAIHHGQSSNGNDHIHLAVQLVREDGTKADVGFDFSRAQDAAREIEREFQLVELETERTNVSEPGYSRAEYEATARRRAEAKYESHRDTEQLSWHEMSKAERGKHIAQMKRDIKAEGMPRESLKVEVRAAAALANTEAEFVGKLYDQGMLIKPFYKDREQTIVGGYQVAMPSKYGEQPWFIAGNSLGHDLSLNRLRSQWETSPESRTEAVNAWRSAGRNLRPTTSTQNNEISADLLHQRSAQIDEHFRQLREIPLRDRDRWATEAQHISGLMSAWAKAGGPHAKHLGKAARNLARSASTKHQPATPHKKPAWMADASQLLIQATSNNNSVAQVVMMQQVLKTVNALAKVHEATKELRRARELRMTIEHDLEKVQSAIPELVTGHGVEQTAHTASFPHSPTQAAAKPPSPMPSAIPERQQSTLEQNRDRETPTR